jgi:lipoyl(octanoyl) transferase
MAQVTVYSLGLLDYQQAYILQDRLLKERIAGKISDTLLLLEHPPTLTLGRPDDRKNLLIPEAELRKQDIAIYPTDRGGSITYHGPGQLVAYPIIDLGQRERDIHKYIRDLEEVIIRTLQHFSISAGRDAKNVGVWVGLEKIAAIGVKVRKWVTKHGFSININSDLSHFSLINPCGITDRGVTSMANILGHEVPMVDVIEAVVDTFGRVFDRGVGIGYPARL